MNSQKQYPNDKLQKSSIIFLQLGLILAMLFVYGVLESEFQQKQLADFTVKEVEIETIPYPPIVNLPDKKKTVVEKIKPKKKKISLEEIKKIKDKGSNIETVLDSVIDIDKEKLNHLIDGLPDFTQPTEEKPEPFILIENAPVFPGCEGLNKKENKICFTKKIAKFVNKKFNTSLAEELGLQGKQRIHVQFVIDKNGTVTDIKTQAPHKRLEKEAKRIIEKLPQMTPGMQRKRPVPVKYSLPINFQVY